MDQTKINETIKILCEKYKDDSFMSSKTEHLICNQLPVLLLNIEKTHAMQVQRITELNAEQDAFIQGFLASNIYFYAPITENFFYYDGVNYVNVTEDEILHKVLSSISRDRTLMSWKYKTKTAIMKRIKENTVFACIPESVTIQSVLNSLYPAVFATKTEAKYFLTILGENMMKKQGDNPLIHIISPVAKSFINELNAMSQMWFGINLNQTFKYKYHSDHQYGQMRIVKTSSSSMMGMGSLNMLFVACHYSNRYHSSDNYLIKYSNDVGIMESTFFLKTVTQELLTTMFIGDYIVSGGTNVQITWKSMLYLWKHFLDSRGLPNVIEKNRLRTILISLLGMHYVESDDCFVGISSKYLPTVQKFLQFWNETIIMDDTEPEIEIGEIATLFRQWSDLRLLTETQIVNILTHFFPELEIDQNKYIYRARSNMWDKQVDIMMAMDSLKDTIGAELYSTISLYDSYVHYCNYVNGSTAGCSADNDKKKRSNSGSLTTPMLVSKQYFEKYMIMNMHN